ncbi:MAG: tetratricopeptide repeat protein [Ahniella sp.]|nr:tetratricopeptide repeat protein [Ahniella sp.]
MLLASAGTVWALTEVVQFSVQRYGVPDVWVDRVLLGGLLALPLVAWLTWRIGAEGEIVWRRRDGAFGIANVLLVLGAVWALPNSSVDPPAPAEVAVLAEPATIPRKPSLLIGAVRTGDEDTLAQDLAFALPTLIETDLQYETGLLSSSFVSLGPRSVLATLAAQGITDPRKADAGAWRLVAKSVRVDAMLVGDLIRVGDEWVLSLVLTRWQEKEIRDTFEVKSRQPAELVDLAASAVRNKMLTDATSLAGEDPSFTSISSELWPALLGYARAREALEIQSRPAEALAMFDEVLAQAPTFAMARWYRLMAQYALGRFDEMKPATEALTRQITQLPLTTRFQLQIFEARLRNDRNAETEVLKLWVTSDPAAPEPLFALAEQDYRNEGSDTSLAALTELARRAPNVDQLLRVASRHEERGDPEAARTLREEAMKRRPTEPEAWIRQAQADEQSGRLDDAEAAYRKAQVLSPNNRVPPSGLVRIRFARGEYEQALVDATAQRKRSTHPASALASAMEHANLLNRLGRHAEALSILEAMYAEQGATMSPTDRASQLDYPVSESIAWARGYDAAKQFIDEHLQIADPASRQFYASQFKFRAAMGKEDFETASTLVPVIEESYRAMDIPIPTSLHRIFAFVALARGPMDTATVESILATDELMDADIRKGDMTAENRISLRIMVIPALLKAGRLDIATPWLDQAMTLRPKDPTMQVLKAEQLRAVGDLGTARTMLESMRPWINKADETSLLRQRFERVAAAID